MLAAPETSLGMVKLLVIRWENWHRQRTNKIKQTSKQIILKNKAKLRDIVKHVYNTISKFDMSRGYISCFAFLNARFNWPICIARWRHWEYWNHLTRDRWETDIARRNLIENIEHIWRRLTRLHGDKTLDFTGKKMTSADTTSLGTLLSPVKHFF